MFFLFNIYTYIIDKGHMDPILVNFRMLYILAQICGLTVIVLITCCLSIYLGGFAGNSDPTHEFNWHPLLMTISLIFLYGNGKYNIQ